MAQMRIFVSHSHQDNEFCVALVKALRDAGADVWFDEHHLGPGELTEKIIEELSKRPVFIVVLSKAALASSWVRDETLWAYTLNKRYRDRIILPVTVEPLEPKQFDTWLFLENFKRVEAPNLRPLPRQIAVEQTLRALVLTPGGHPTSPKSPILGGDVEEVIAYGKALSVQKKYELAASYFHIAAHMSGADDDALVNLGLARLELQDWQTALDAFDLALHIDKQDFAAWEGKGDALIHLHRENDARNAYQQAAELREQEIERLLNEEDRLFEEEERLQALRNTEGVDDTSIQHVRAEQSAMAYRTSELMNGLKSILFKAKASKPQNTDLPH